MGLDTLLKKQMVKACPAAFVTDVKTAELFPLPCAIVVDGTSLMRSIAHSGAGDACKMSKSGISWYNLFMSLIWRFIEQGTNRVVIVLDRGRNVLKSATDKQRAITQNKNAQKEKDALGEHAFAQQGYPKGTTARVVESKKGPPRFLLKEHGAQVETDAISLLTLLQSDKSLRPQFTEFLVKCCQYDAVSSPRSIFKSFPDATISWDVGDGKIYCCRKDGSTIFDRPPIELFPEADHRCAQWVSLWTQEMTHRNEPPSLPKGRPTLFSAEVQAVIMQPQETECSQCLTFVVNDGDAIITAMQAVARSVYRDSYNQKHVRVLAPIKPRNKFSHVSTHENVKIVDACGESKVVIPQVFYYNGARESAGPANRFSFVHINALVEGLATQTQMTPLHVMVLSMMCGCDYIPRWVHADALSRVSSGGKTAEPQQKQQQQQRELPPMRKSDWLKGATSERIWNAVVSILASGPQVAMFAQWRGLCGYLIDYITADVKNTALDAKVVDGGVTALVNVVGYIRAQTKDKNHPRRLTVSNALAHIAAAVRDWTCACSLIPVSKPSAATQQQQQQTSSSQPPAK